MKKYVQGSEESIQLIRENVTRKSLKGELTKVQEEILYRILNKASHAVRVRSLDELLAAVGHFAKKYRQFVD